MSRSGKRVVPLPVDPAARSTIAPPTEPQPDRSSRHRSVSKQDILGASNVPARLIITHGISYYSARACLYMRWLHAEVPPLDDVTSTAHSVCGERPVSFPEVQILVSLGHEEASRRTIRFYSKESEGQLQATTSRCSFPPGGAPPIYAGRRPSSRHGPALANNGAT
ncbi:hypothetical protein DAEQUDRAFT_605290 [Daedalea quercina L-15889]|uniref:Uncharacterized protein n=1 Tax=Daedalea quercina L-15889 TaxID=1314783 RepID=A0A165LJU7_9APHY|nr:hypothetical protein DAEQUDRAFT_605290 [Daedalea quercina L-15889]